MITNRKTLLLAVLALIAACLLCSCAAKGIDGLCDKLDRSVTELVKLSEKTVFVNKAAKTKLAAKLADIRAVNSELQQLEDDMTEAQLERYMGIVDKLLEAF